MGKAWKWGTGWGALAVVAWIAYGQDPQSTTTFIIAIILTLFSVISFLVYFVLLVKKRMYPLDILDDIRCTYWPKERQIGVILWICDRSNSSEFKVSCSVQFGTQVVNVNDRIELDGIYMGITVCKGGRKRMVEFSKNDVVVEDPSKCLATITIKPQGIWATKRKSKKLDVQIVNHQ